MSRSLTLFVVLSLWTSTLWGVPAYPHKIPVRIGGTFVHIRMFGDEHRKWAESEDGYALVQDSTNQWCYALQTADGRLAASHHRLAPLADRSGELQSFLKSTPLHMKPAPAKCPARNQHRPKKAAVGERRMLIILMEYQDVAFRKTAEDFNQLFNQQDYRAEGAKGSVRDFYDDASYGQLQLTSDIYGPYQARHNMAYYGGNDANGNDQHPYELFREAIQIAAAETELTQYDGDGDGYLDNVHIVFAGYGEEAGAAADAIWSHEMSFSPYMVQGMKIDHYSCAPELRGSRGSGISRIGPHCHEIGHALGAMDFYDTNYETGGSYLGTGDWDVMAGGSWNDNGVSPADFNAYVKAFNYGWVTPKPLERGEVTIAPSNVSSDNYYIIREKGHTDYYLLENRSHEGWGKAVPGQGLLLLHVHGNINFMANSNTINATAPQHCYYVCASSNYEVPGRTPSSYGSINSAGCPYPGSSNSTSFNDQSVPRAFFWDSDECSLNLHDIHLDGEGNILLFSTSSQEQGGQEIDGIFYSLHDEEMTATVTHVNGVYADVVIPAVVKAENGKDYTVNGVSSNVLAVEDDSYNLSVTFPHTIVEVADDAFDESNTCAFIWLSNTPLPSESFAHLSEKWANMLLYVNSIDVASPYLQNVIVGGVAENIQLRENCMFHCPQAFIAHYVAFTHEFTMQTVVGSQQGWETMALPFDVTSITHSTKGELTPFASFTPTANAKPFWLYEWTEAGFARASGIQANTPYLISMPNNDSYLPEYNVAGDVTFAATEATIHTTLQEDLLLSYRHDDVLFFPQYCFERQSADNLLSRANINSINHLHSETGGYAPGSVFMKNLRATSPFEGYLYDASSEPYKRQVIQMDFSDDVATDINNILLRKSSPQKDNQHVVNLYGQHMGTMERGAKQRLLSGIYIIGGRKTFHINMNK